MPGWLLGPAQTEGGKVSCAELVLGRSRGCPCSHCHPLQSRSMGQSRGLDHRLAGWGPEGWGTCHSFSSSLYSPAFMGSWAETLPGMGPRWSAVDPLKAPPFLPCTSPPLPSSQLRESLDGRPPKLFSSFPSLLPWISFSVSSDFLCLCSVSTLSLPLSLVLCLSVSVSDICLALLLSACFSLSSFVSPSSCASFGLCALVLFPCSARITYLGRFPGGRPELSA